MTIMIQERKEKTRIPSRFRCCKLRCKEDGNWRAKWVNNKQVLTIKHEHERTNLQKLAKDRINDLTRDLQLQQHRVQCLGHALAIVLRHLSTLPQQQPTKRPQKQNQKQQSNDNDDGASNARRTPTLRVPKEESEEDKVKTRVTERSFLL